MDNVTGYIFPILDDGLFIKNECFIDCLVTYLRKALNDKKITAEFTKGPYLLKINKPSCFRNIDKRICCAYIAGYTSMIHINWSDDEPT